MHATINIKTLVGFVIPNKIASHFEVVSTQPAGARDCLPNVAIIQKTVKAAQSLNYFFWRFVFCHLFSPSCYGQKLGMYIPILYVKNPRI
jgi:hypothetical protein